jgi:hypothetical protein
MMDPATIAAWASIGAAIGASALWLRKEMRETADASNEKMLHSDAFDARVTKIVVVAFAASSQHITTAIADLEVRQRDHGRRLGAVEQEVAALRGRIQASRQGDA